MHTPTLLLLAALSLALFAAPAAARPALISPDSAAPPDTAGTASADTTADTAALRWAARAAAARRQVRADLAARTPLGRGAALAEAFGDYRRRRTAIGSAPLAFPESAAPFVDAQRTVVASRFAEVVGRAGRLLPMIAEALERRGLPDELKYVAVIESSLNTRATSPAGAAGLWQFMPATAAQFGLTSRSVRDPVRSTEAAVRFLDGLGRTFGGDWQLALAAYNCGPARVSRLVSAYRARTGETPTFWDVRESLPRETRDYVARFIAAAQHFEG